MQKLETTRERTSFTFDPKTMLLSLQFGFSFVRAAMTCAILQRISSFKQSCKRTAPRYLQLVAVPYFCPFTLIYLWMPLALFVINLALSFHFDLPLDAISAVCHQFGLLSTDLHPMLCADFFETLN